MKIARRSLVPLLLLAACHPAFALQMGQELRPQVAHHALTDADGEPV